MRTITTTTNVYKFEELSSDAKEHALDKYRDWMTDNPYWYTCIEEDWKDKFSDLGIEKPEIEFSGFYSQGDGAVFTSKNISLIKLLDGLNMVDDYKDIYDWLTDDVIDISTNIDRISTYYEHEGTAKLSIQLGVINDDFELSNDDFADLEDKIVVKIQQLENKLEQWRRETCKELYSDLMQEYEMLQSDDVLKETFIENEYEFTEDGEMFP